MTGNQLSKLSKALAKEVHFHTSDISRGTTAQLWIWKLQEQ